MERLVDLVTEGKASLVAAQSLAKSAVEDGIPSPAMKIFSSLGCGGKFPNNLERDFHRWLNTLFGLDLEVYMISFQLQASFLSFVM